MMTLLIDQVVGAAMGRKGALERGLQVAESTNPVIDCAGRMWAREGSVMLPTFLRWWTG